VIGGISIILAFFAFQTLPINFAGLLLILFGVVLLIAEIKVVSHGVLAVGGVVAMALGSIMLFDAPEWDLRVSLWVVAPTVAVTAGVFLFMIGAGIRALASRSAVGATALSPGNLTTSSARARCGSRRMKPRSSSPLIRRWIPDFERSRSASFISSKDGATPVAASR
jgi:membrane-bound ClpP family serine protease